MKLKREAWSGGRKRGKKEPHISVHPIHPPYPTFPLPFPGSTALGGIPKICENPAFCGW